MIEHDSGSPLDAYDVIVEGIPTREQAEVMEAFTQLLRASSEDGGKKRAAGLKPSWKIDTSHEAAIFSHLNKWKHGERKDTESGAHPLVHLAWRALAIAFQENTYDAERNKTERCSSNEIYDTSTGSWVKQ